jgi:hypothetical protein
MKVGYVVDVVLVGMVAILLSGVPAHGASQSDAWVPGLASLIIPGLGQLLNDQVDKAVLHFGVLIGIYVAGSLGSLAPMYGQFWPIIGLTAHLAWSAYSGIDAYNVAKETGFSLSMTENGLTFSYSF